MSTTADVDRDAIVLYRFAGAELDLRARELRIDGQAVRTEMRVLKVLAALLARPGETLTKDELMAAAWPGRVITDGALTKAVMKLRQALGDDGQMIIRTVHGFGYRMGVAVEAVGGESNGDFRPIPGGPVPLRANWRLVRPLGPARHDHVWLAEHVKTHDRRVFKFAADPASLLMLKREITLYRLIHDSLGEGAPVVRLLDWNLDEPPYFTEAEWIDGGEYANWIEGQAGIEERIAVFIALADAVAATHGVGIVHKDLKPANVLLRRQSDGGMVVLLADFGIGALSDSRAIEALGITRLGFTDSREHRESTSGTPLYLAPEVVAGHPPTQRSDIYALGVILFQTLVGDGKRPLAPGWEREIDDELLREDIAATADVDPARRLGGAAELAMRLRRLTDRRASRQAEKLAQEQARQLAVRLVKSRVRQRWLAALASVLVISTVIGVNLFLSAEREREVAEAVNQFLNEDLLAAANPYVTQQPGMTVRAALDRASAAVEERFQGSPRAEAAVQMTLARSYRGIGEYALAQAHATRAAELTGEYFSANSDAAFQARLLLGELDFDLGESQEGDRKLSELDAQVQRHRQRDDRSLEIALTRASQWIRRREPETVLELLEPVMLTVEASRNDKPDNWIWSLTMRGNALRQAGKHDEATDALEQALAFAVGQWGQHALRTLSVKESLGQLHRAEGRYAEAEALQRDVVDGRIAQLGRKQPEAQGALNELAVILQDMGRHDEAEPLLREVLAERIRLYGERNPLTRDILNNLGMSLSLSGRLDEAESYYRRALDIERDLLGPDHLDVLILSHNLAGLLRRKLDFEEAIKLHREAVEAAQATLGTERAEAGLFMVGLAHTLGAAGRYTESDAAYEQAHERLEQALGPDHPRVARVLEMRQEMRDRASAP